MLTFLLVMTVFSATLLLPCRVENGENVEGKGLDNNAKKTLSEEIQINMPNPVFLCARSPCDTVQVMETNSSLNELSGILMDEVVKNTAIEEIQIDMPNRVSLCVRSQCDTVQKVVSNINSTTTDQAEIDTEETTNLLHQTPNESRDSTANNCLIGLTVESMEEFNWKIKKRLELAVADGEARLEAMEGRQHEWTELAEELEADIQSVVEID
ncbi:hypothetical protein HHK36_023296 [Tetracentron sinense]|uniref:Uncharacterized protein n=1 Tax=Tetracentron sinense TaxID=13715 RepID=A0A834YSW6_TETSI|nr:hypothetical protein HHK36_023296 [Tetracentron sinense]